MNLLQASHEILNLPDYQEALRHIERVGRTCYKSEERITEDSAEKFVRMLIKRGHEAMIEHISFSVKFICDRGVSHEIVRHRIASFAQESTRYCNYSPDKKGMSFIVPEFKTHRVMLSWYRAMREAEWNYNNLLGNGVSPQIARSVLPNSLKTELIMTTNIREWRHFLKLRCARDAHPQMRELVIPFGEELKEKYPAFFEDIVW